MITYNEFCVYTNMPTKTTLPFMYFLFSKTFHYDLYKMLKLSDKLIIILLRLFMVFYYSRGKIKTNICIIGNYCSLSTKKKLKRQNKETSLHSIILFHLFTR